MILSIMKSLGHMWRRRINPKSPLTTSCLLVTMPSPPGAANHQAACTNMKTKTRLKTLPVVSPWLAEHIIQLFIVFMDLLR